MVNHHKKRSTFKIWRLGLLEGDNELFALHTYSKGAQLGTVPPDLRHFVSEENAAHASYSGVKPGFVSVHLLKTTPEALFRLELAKDVQVFNLEDEIQIDSSADQLDFWKVNKKKPRAEKTMALDEIARTHGVQMSTSVEGELADLIYQGVLNDVARFTGDKPPKTAPEPFLRTGAALQPKPVIVPIPLVPGKLVRRGKGQYFDTCALDVGVDISQGCIANQMSDGRYNPYEMCNFCYAQYENRVPFASSLMRVSSEEFVRIFNERIKGMKWTQGKSTIKPSDKKILTTRLGQDAEFFPPPAIQQMEGYIDTPKEILEGLVELKKEYNTRGVWFRTVAVTRSLTFDSDTANLLKSLNASLMFSVGYDSLEPWTNCYDCGTERRIEESIRFAESGVRTGLFVMTDITRGPEQFQREAKLAVTHHIAYPQIGLHWIDARITAKTQAEIIGGAPWSWLRGTSKMRREEGLLTYGFEAGGWEAKSGNLVAKRVHPFFQRFAREKKSPTNLERLCYTHGTGKYNSCGDCFLNVSRE
ncbi:MAG: hypothetical protein ABIA93_03915 [Candidatus Woesearchaeota archaeon]